MCGASGNLVFRGDIMFTLKDCQHSAVDEIHAEFQGKLEEVVQQVRQYISTLCTSFHTTIILTS